MLKLRALTAFMACLALASACSKAHDPTQILAPAATTVTAPPVVPTPTPLPSGVQLQVRRQADTLGAVQHVWVENSGGTNILTLWTTNGAASPNYSCPPSDFCPCESGDWTAYCTANPADLTDANTGPTVFYALDSDLAYNWDWKDRSLSVVPNGTYRIRAEISSYNYGGSPSLASVTVTKNGLSGSALGTVNNRWISASASWNP